MTEPKMISPLLDNFIMGGAMSEHHGVRCYPAIENETGEKYIVKVISVPATAAQLDALLLTGAFPDKVSAIAYFADMANGTLDEVSTLEKLAELEGFTSYTASQMVPTESGDGFDIYLLGTYKRALDKYFQKHTITHLDALNLGIDLCAALSVSRQLGYIFVDLKPGNIFVNDQRQFKIGDLGFIPLRSLKYTSVPEKYISIYTPPEICDAFSELNTTMDVYAAGLILYQAYNNGALPFNAEIKPGDALPAPLYADYEMSEIILKACAANPEDRWQDPTQMGQAIISYMQRNGASDSPIVPMPVPVTDENQNNQEDAEDTDSIPVPEDLSEEASEASQNNTEDTAHTTADSEVIDDEVVDSSLQNAEVVESESADDPTVEALNSEAFTDTDADDEDIHETSDEVTLTEEVTEMLNQADELATMPVPEPVVVPDYVDVPVPEPETETEPESKTEDESYEEESNDAGIEYAEPETVEEEIGDESDDEAVEPVKKRRWIGKLILVLLFLALLVGGYFFYKEYYLVPIDIRSVEGDTDKLTVWISTDVDESKLTVICSGDYGIEFFAPVINGKAEFAELVPNTAYNIHIDIDGFHRLVGNIQAAYSTPAQTNIIQFDAITGDTDDSAILTFTVEGPSCEKWSVVYSAEGEAEKTALFTDNMVTLSNLVVGKEYTFKLLPSSDLYVTGQSTITFTPRPIVIAKELHVTSCVNNTLSVAWKSPDNTVTNWSVHCYNDTYNQTITTSETIATFTGLDHTAGYTIEVKAAGMSKGDNVVIPANSVTAENFQIDTTDPTKLMVSWSTAQDIPESGWLLRYSVLGINNIESIPCNTNSAIITPIIPNATYKIHIEDVNGMVLLNSERTITTGAAIEFTKEFNGVATQASDLEFTMCKTPSNPGWGRYDLSADDYRSTFTIGESASFLVKFDKLHNAPNEEVSIMYVTLNQDGEIIHSGIQIKNWENMWKTTYCKLNVPVTPSTAGQYTLDIYFNGMLVHKQAFTVK